MDQHHNLNLDKDLTRLPLAIVVVGSFAGLILLVNVLILVSNRLQGKSKAIND